MSDENESKLVVKEMLSIPESKSWFYNLNTENGERPGVELSGDNRSYNVYLGPSKNKSIKRSESVVGIKKPQGKTLQELAQEELDSLEEKQSRWFDVYINGKLHRPALC